MRFPRRLLAPCLLALSWFAAAVPARAVLATFEAYQDNTLFENEFGGLSNGIGPYLYAGMTGSSADYALRRSLIQFDLSTIPEDALIESVTLTLYLSRSAAGSDASLISLHTVNASWGEGLSNAGDPGGTGAPAQPNDATWLHRFYSGTLWSTPGGDFTPAPSATASVSTVDVFYDWTGAGLVGDVQAWVNGTLPNNGWAILGDESTESSAKRFNSRSHATLGTQPLLTVEYSIIPEPEAAGLLLLLAAFCGAGGRWRRLRPAGCVLFAAAMTHAQGQISNPIPDPILQGPLTIGFETVASGLVSPTLLLTAPGDVERQFIVEQTGLIRILEDGVVQPTPFLDLASRLVSLSASYDERGLLGVAFDPGFSNPASPGYGRIFTYTSEPVASGTPDYVPPLGANGLTNLNHHSVVASWRVDPLNPDAIDPASRVEILRFGEPQANHNGGAMAFGPDGLLYIGTGDGGGANDTNPTGHNPTTGNGQDSNTVLGKMLRIDVNGTNSTNGKYGIPETNPFATSGGAKEIYATGFRNPYSFSFDGTDLLVADVGQNKIEELDRVVAGGNYGWRYKEGTFRFNTDGTVSDDLTGLPEGLIDPILQYDHDEGVSIIGGFVYHGALLPDLAGKYIFGDFARNQASPTGRIFYADLSTGEIREFTIAGPEDSLGLYVKGFGQDQDGEIYLLGSAMQGPSGATGVALKLVPEPGAAMLAALGLALVAGRRRRGYFTKP